MAETRLTVYTVSSITNAERCAATQEQQILAAKKKKTKLTQPHIEYILFFFFLFCSDCSEVSLRREAQTSVRMWRPGGRSGALTHRPTYATLRLWLLLVAVS